MSKKNTELEIVTTPLSEIKICDLSDGININELINEFGNIEAPNLSNPTLRQDLKVIKKGLSSFVTARTTIEKARKKLKAPAIAYGKAIDTACKNLTKMVEPHEIKLKGYRNDIEAHIKAEKEAKTAEKARLEAIEKERVESIKQNISDISNMPIIHVLSSSLTINEAIELLEIPMIEDFEEFHGEAVMVYNNCITALNSLLADAIKREEYQKQLEKERLEREEAEKARLAAIEKQKEFNEAKENTIKSLVGKTAHEILEAILNNEIPNVKWVQQ